MDYLLPTSTASRLDPCGKGLGAFDAGHATADVAALDWHLLDGDISLPVAVLCEERVQHNLRWMQRFTQAYGVQLAPHGKTTMSPALFRRQIEGGAWGITLATAPQVRAAWRGGVRRVLMANQLVGRANMAIIAGLMQADPAFDFTCLVDSPVHVEQLGAYFGERGLVLRVLIELGVEGGRAGVRSQAQMQAVADALARWPALALSGVEIYEGVLQTQEAVRAFARRAVDSMRSLAAAGCLDQRGRAMISGAGSAWFDVVAEEFSQLDIAMPLDIVLRPGCYLSHDVGIYRSAAQRIHAGNRVAQQMEPGLLPALQVWAHVQSLPESGRAIVGMGKRDAAFDAGLPVPSLHHRPGHAAACAAPPHWKLTAMMDQHAFMQTGQGDDLQVGDMIAFDISHPCLTFDKWRQILLVDAQLRVIDVVQTFF